MKLISLVLASLLLGSLLGCSKKSFNKSSNSKLVDALNSNNPDYVIARIAPDKASHDERYWLASAYALRAKVDVINLYSMLEMFLFNRSAWDWDDLDEVRDPYRTFLTSVNVNQTQEDANSDRRRTVLARSDNYLRRRFKMDVPLPSCEGVSPASYASISSTYAAIVAQAEYSPGDYFNEEPETYFPEPIFDSSRASTLDPQNDAWKEWKCKLSLRERYIDMFRYHRVRYRYDLYDSNNETSESEDDGLFSLTTESWQNIAMEILWKTYESIPFLQRVPIITQQGQADVTQASDLMLELIQVPAYRQRALKSLLYWNSVSILSLYRTGFDFENSTSVKQMYCHFDPRPVVNSYSILLSRVKTLRRLYDYYKQDRETEERTRRFTATELERRHKDDASLAKNIARLDRSLQNAPAELDPEVRDTELEKFMNKQVDNCIIQD